MLRLLYYKTNVLLGILIGVLLFQIVLFSRKDIFRCTRCSGGGSLIKKKISSELYDVELADELYDEVKVLCWVMISPEFHHTRGIHIKNTWGRRCNKLLFMSSTNDPEIDSIALPMEEKITHLWTKTRKAFQYIHDHDELLNNFDWFLKADDDAYMVMENVRHMLYQYKPQTALYFGQRLTGNESLDGYMQGGAYILSRKAVQKFVKLYPERCRQKDGWAEDLYMGMCLTNQSIFVDTRDNLKQMRFLMFGVHKYFPKKYNPQNWFYEKAFYDVPHHSLDCCSDLPVGFHYIKQTAEMYLMEYLIYRVHPFGIDKSSHELPEKLSLKEILRRSDVGSNSTLYKQHEVIHELESSEIF